MKRKIILTFTLIWTTCLLSAEEVYFRHIDFKSEPKQVSAISIYQDKENRIWFGNTSLNVYDGEHVSTFLLSSFLPEIQDTNIHNLCGDNESTLYMLANTHLISYNYKYDKFIDTGIEANTLYYDKGTLYYGKQNLFATLQEDNTSNEIYTLPSECTITALHPYQNGWLLGSNNGLYFYTDNRIEVLYDKIAVSTLFIDNNEDIWVGTTSNGVFRLLENQWIHLEEGENSVSLVNNQIRCFNEDENGKIWIGTFRGITILDPYTNQTRHIYQEETSGWFIRHSSIYDIMKDHQGGMWIGTYYGGLSYFNPDTERYTFYPAGMKEKGKLNGFLFGKMTEDEKGNVYIATENGQINTINKYTGKTEPFLLKKPVKQPFTTSKSVWYNPDNKSLYIGTFLKGLYKYSIRNNSLEELGKDILHSDWQRIITDLIEWEDYLILVTQSELYKMHKETEEITPFFDDTSEKQQLSGVILSSFLDKKNNWLWLSPAHKEILCLDLKTQQFISHPKLNEYTGKRNIESIAGDNEGKIYLVVQGVGLIEYNYYQEQIYRYSKESGHLSTNEPFNVAVIRPGVVIITSFKNISLLNFNDDITKHTFLGDASPLHNLNRNCGIYISPETKDIFVGGIGGIISFTEEELITPETDYTIGFNTLYINNQLSSPNTPDSYMETTMPFLQSIRLPYNKNNISIGFFSTDFRHIDFNHYEYRLEGLDKQWIPTNHKLITYSSLPPGNYQLQVRETNSGKEITLDISITPPFYLSSVAWLIYFLLGVLILIWVILFNRNQAVLKASLALEKKEKLQIEELNQMKLRFYINISHELRTPLTLISNQLDLILTKNGLSGSVQRKFTKIKQYTEQLNLLISEILDLRKLEQGKMPLRANYTDIISFTQKIYDSFQDYASYKKVNYRFEYAKDSLYIWFDPVQMQKVFNNLLSNAFKFTESNGTICIRIEEDTNFLLLSVEDSGCGIPEEHIEHIFKRFYQINQSTTDSSIGTGIGLALTKEIIHQHAGYIKAESEPNKGTRFTVYLRKGDSHLTNEQKATEQQEIIPEKLLPPTSVSLPENEEEVLSEDSSKERKKILLIEDNQELLSLLTEAFNPMYIIRTAGNGNDGLKQAEEFLPDLIISDVMMPGLNGVEICRGLKQRISTSHIPVILLSARTDQEKVLEALQTGATDYITKPFNLEMLLLKCKNLLRDQSEWTHKISSDQKITSAELATNKLDQEILDKSIEIIEQHIGDKDFSIESWCREIAMGRTRLGLKIKAITGMTLNDFILHIKLRKCGELLNKNELSISEIAWECGFSSAGYMGKCFKQQYGMTPMEYRNRRKVEE